MLTTTTLICEVCKTAHLIILPDSLVPRKKSDDSQLSLLDLPEWAERFRNSAGICQEPEGDTDEE